MSDAMAMRLVNKKKGIPFVTYTLTLIQVIVFIVEIVKNAQLTGSPIEIHPSFNPMIGPSPYVVINMGSRFTPCMHNMTGIPDLTAISWPCPNTTSSTDVECSISDLCGFGGVGATPDQCGIFGFILGGNFAATGISSTGASGALFGLIALTLLDLLYKWQERVSPYKELAFIALDIVISFVLGLLPGLDNFSHIGGFLMGLVLGLSILRSPNSLRMRTGQSDPPYAPVASKASQGDRGIISLFKNPSGFFKGRKPACRLILPPPTHSSWVATTATTGRQTQEGERTQDSQGAARVRKTKLPKDKDPHRTDKPEVSLMNRSVHAKWGALFRKHLGVLEAHCKTLDRVQQAMRSEMARLSDEEKREWELNQDGPWRILCGLLDRGRDTLVSGRTMARFILPPRLIKDRKGLGVLGTSYEPLVPQLDARLAAEKNNSDSDSNSAEDTGYEDEDVEMEDAPASEVEKSTAAEVEAGMKAKAEKKEKAKKEKKRKRDSTGEESEGKKAKKGEEDDDDVKGREIEEGEVKEKKSKSDKKRKADDVAEEDEQTDGKRKKKSK
ncbi:hypothetical protein DID88_005128 [Monilinia fructigena]|uniref:Rhomboid-type serine protease n=1 Tax=Monilinia fructigena TaxID=38457 RepID=A0A395IGG0_9HELO|nr:hypothetical protein DID88_005128 [Monilinia fructigena]